MLSLTPPESAKVKLRGSGRKTQGWASGSPVQRSFVCFRQLRTWRGLDLGGDGPEPAFRGAKKKTRLRPDSVLTGCLYFGRRATRAAKEPAYVAG
jgi:hypothetical protein